MKFKVFLLATIVLLSGCKKADERTLCLRGVEYYSYGYKLAPALKTDGTPYLCEKWK